MWYDQRQTKKFIQYNLKRKTNFVANNLDFFFFFWREAEGGDVIDLVQTLHWEWKWTQGCLIPI